MILPGRLQDVAAGFRQFPRMADWRVAAIETAWAVPLMFLVAHLGGLASFAPIADASMLAPLAATLFFAPALGEELLFRGLLIPRAPPRAGWITLSVLLFVLWHPFQTLTFGPPWAATFLDPWFLGTVAILGIALARIYAKTGSIWPGVALHWMVVLGWKALLGGPF